MSRINRRKWTMNDFGDKTTHGLFGLIDDMMKSNFRITDDEYDFLCETLNDTELGLFATEKTTFSEKRKVIEILNKHIKY